MKKGTSSQNRLISTRLMTTFVFIFFLLCFGNVKAQLLQWNTFGNAGTETTEPSVANDANIAGPVNLTNGGGFTHAANANRYGGTGWFNTGNTVAGSTIAEAIAGNDYVQFIVTPNPGFSFTPTSFVFSWDKSGTGPKSVALRSSADGFATDLGTVLTAAIGTFNTITISGLTNLTTATTFRAYGYNGTATGGTGGFDIGTNVVNVTLNGTTAPIVVPPTQLVIASISNQVAGAPFSITVESRDGSNVLSNVAAATGFTLSTNGNAGVIGGTTTGTIAMGTNSIVVSGITLASAGSGATITATRTSGDVLTAGTSNTFNVSAASTPTIVVTGSLTAFLTAVSTQSSSQSYTVSGTDLSSDIVITPPANFKIRTGVAAFSSSPINLTPSSGTVGTTTIDVLYEPGVAGPHSGNITHTSTLASTVNQAVSGATLATEPTIASTTTIGAITSATAVVNFTGGNGARRIVVARPSTAVSFVPTDNVSPSGVNNDFSAAVDQGSGNKIVYDGTGTTVTVNNLSAGTTYHFAVYEFNGTAGVENYFATAGTANTTLPGPINYTTIGATYTQDFNSLPLAGTYSYSGQGSGPFFTSVAPINAASTVGWQHARIAGSTVDAKFSFDNGSANSGSTFSYGTAAAADRALGMLASGSNINRIGAVIRNNTGSTLSYINITYVGEQWRYGAGVANTLTFGYQVGGTDISTGSFTAVSGLDFTSPVTSGGAGTRDGNLSINRTNKSATVALGTPWLAGTDLVIRWDDIDNSGSDDGLGIDDFNFSASAIAAPVQLAITSVNGGSSPTINVPFNVTVTAVDNSNFPQNVIANTDVTLSLNTGTGAFGGTLTGSILAGTSSVIITGVTYNTAEAGVSLTASRTAGDVLTSGNSASFTVLGAADHLAFVGFPLTGGTNNNLTTFTVEARRSDNSVDVNYTGNITLSIASGPGVISGTLVKAAVAGIATFTNIKLDLVGNYTLDASASGLTSATSSTIAISAAPYMTELVVPQYMGAKTDPVLNLNNTRTPVAVCVQFFNLNPSAAYDLKAGMALTSEGSTGYGAGNWWDGALFGQNNLQNAFTTDASGNTGPVWVYLQPSGNASRFGAGQIHNIRVGVTLHAASMPANPQFIGSKTITSLDVATIPLTVSTADDGAYLTGRSAICADGKHVLLYDNTAGTGNPLYSFLIRQASVTNGSSSELPTAVNEIWSQSGASLAGDFAAIIPIGANNPNGVRRIESRNEDNSVFGASTDADGVWPSSANTTTVLSKAVVALTQTDAPAIDFALPTCVVATANNISCPTGVSLSWPSSGDCDTYLVNFGTDNPPTDILMGWNVGTSLSYNLPVLASNTPYYYQIVSVNVFGQASGCTIGTFTTGSSFTVTPTQSPSSYTETMDNGVTPPALPCGMTSSNENFPVDAFTWYTSTTAPHGGSRHLAIDKNTNNTTAKDDWVYSAPMNLTAGKLYRIYFYYRVSNAANPEQFELFVSNSADAATMTSTSSVKQLTGLTNLTYVLDSTADIIPLLTGIHYYGIHANSAAGAASLYLDDIQVKEIPVAALDPGSCITIPSLYDQLLVQPIYGAQDYKFKIENLGISYSYEFTRNLAIPDFRLKWAPGVVYGETYDVSVSYKKNNVWSPYGASCPVTMGPFPTTQLRGASCGATLTDLYTPLYIDSVGGANDYEYKIVQNTLAYDHTWMRGAPALDYRLYWAYQTSPLLVERVQFGFTYDVQVRALVGRTGPAQGNLPGTLGTFGPTCTVTLSGQPQTQLVAAPGPQQSCGKTLTNITDQIYCIPVVGAGNYRYTAVNAALGYNATADRNSTLNDFRLNWLPTVGGIGLRYATTYDITVQNNVGGVWSTAGAMCQVTTPAQPLTELQPAYCLYTLPTFSSPIYCNPVPAATNYRYHITGPMGYDKTITRNSGGTDFRFTWTLVCCGGQNVLPNTPYTVEVASYAGGVWSAYGNPCTVTTSATVPRYNPFLAEDGKVEAAAAELGLSVYPNPSAVNETYYVELNGIQQANEKVAINIYNVLGAKVYSTQVITKEESRVVLQPEQTLAAGVYTVEAQINGTVSRVKFVVR